MSDINVGLALSGGSVLGIAQVGVIAALEDSGISPNIIAGTSMGALIGGVYANGVSIKEIEEKCKKIRVWHMYSPSFSLSGMSSGSGVVKLIAKVIGDDIAIEKMERKYCAVAYDLISGNEVELKKGSLLQSIRASISLPGVFTPVQMGDMSLIDGGVVNNLPDDVVKGMGADVVLSVNVLYGYITKCSPKTPIHSVVFAFATMLREMVARKKSYSDIRINLDLNKYQLFDFKEQYVEEIIKIGYDETIKVLPKIKKLIKQKINKLNI